MTIDQALKQASERFENVSVDLTVCAYKSHAYKRMPSISVHGWNQSTENMKTGRGSTIGQALKNLLNPPNTMSEIQSAVQEVEEMAVK